MGLYRLIDDILDNPRGILACVWEWEDRLSRSPGLSKVFKHLLHKYGIPGICVEKSQFSPDSYEQQIEELCSYIQVLNSRYHGKRGGLARKVDIPEKTMQYAYKLKAENGLSDRRIAEILEKENYRDSKGRVIKRPTLSNYLKTNYVALQQAYGKPKRNNFAEFLSLYVKKTTSRRCTVARTKIVSAYYSWCKDKGYVPTSNPSISRLIFETFKVEGVENGHKGIKYRYLSLCYRD